MAWVRAALDALVRETGVDELMVTTMVHDHADRLRSFELLADVWGGADYCTPTRSITNTSVSLGPTGPEPVAP